jgi:hypothetical protein
MATDKSGSAGYVQWATAVIRLGWRSWRAMGFRLLIGSVVPGLIVTACMLSATAFTEGQITGNGIEVAGNAVFLVLLVPLSACSGFWITDSWVRAAAHLDVPDNETTSRLSRSVLRGTYLAGLGCLLVAAALAPYLDGNAATPIDLGNIPVIGFVLAFSGPLGLLSPIALLAPRAAFGAPPSSASRSGTAARLGIAAVAAVGYGLMLGYLTYALTDWLQADGFVSLGAVLANLLAVPLLIFLLSASTFSPEPYPRRPG